MPQSPKEGPPLGVKLDWPDALEPPKEGPAPKPDWPDALGPPKEKPLAEGVKLGRYSEVELSMLSRC